MTNSKTELCLHAHTLCPILYLTNASQYLELDIQCLDISLFKIMSLCLHNLISSCYIFEHHVTVFSADASTFVSRHRESANHSERANSPLNLFVCGSDDYVKL